MNDLRMREKAVLILCVCFATLLLVSGIYDFAVIAWQFSELMMSVGVFFLLIGIGLMARLFFMPLTSMTSSINMASLKAITVGSPKIQQWVYLLGIFFCLFSLVWRFLFA
ncbi:hypothetical protein [Pseudoalteromonas aurantia]|uniref:Uncharacterized protein n=1 Tax=Pseudoalteromonas aurantia TaxID=43654 RepID=A0A5S3VA48_9GAMM|nr:hypothetical protein [Pseudoalteromonas aurantia]TMO68797.1 hypothetical protein CWC19_07710 [Pseudoalteromonas aurantia]